MRQLALDRSRKPGVSDYLPWAVLAGSGDHRPSVVQTKRGAFLAAYYFSPPDNASSTDEMAAYVSDRCNEALMRFGTGWSTWVDAVSVAARPYPPAALSAFPDPISRLIDEERRRAYDAEGAHFENERAMVVCYHPPHAAVGKLEGLFYDDDGAARDGSLSHMAEGFERTLGQFEAALGGIIGLRRMAGFTFVDEFGRRRQQDELVNYLNFCATGRTHGVNIPDCGAYLDTLIGGQDMDPGDVPIIGDSYLMCVTIDGFPAESVPNVLDSLCTLPVAYRFTQRMIYLDTHDAERVLGAYRRAWSSRVLPFMAQVAPSVFKSTRVNQHAADMRDDAQSALSLASSNQVRFGYYTATIVLRGPDPDKLRQLCNDTARVIEDCGYVARIETVNTIDAWRGTLPGEISAQVRRPPMHTANVSDLLPLSGVWTGSPAAPCPLYPAGAPALMHARTVGSIPFRANLHVGDVGHTLLFGPTGSGKSSLLNTIVLQALRYPGMRITGFDNKRGMMATTLACGGRYYELGAEQSPALCPLALLETDHDRAHAEEWIAICFELQEGRALSPQQRSEVHHAIQRLRERPEHRSITDFCLAVQDSEVRLAMRHYTLEGAAGALTDGDGRTSAIQEVDFTVYETLDLMGLGKKTALPVLLSLFRRFERGLDGRPSLLVIDEGWIVLGDPVWSDKLRGWLKLLRSRNCAVLLATQSLSDAVRSGMIDVLMESCPTKIFGANPEAHKGGTAEHPGPRDFYERMGLNSNQIGILRNAALKRHWYWTSPEGNRLIEPGMGPVQLAFAGATSEEDVGRVRRLADEHGDQWMWRHLDGKGIRYDHLR